MEVDLICLGGAILMLLASKAATLLERCKTVEYNNVITYLLMREGSAAAASSFTCMTEVFLLWRG